MTDQVIVVAHGKALTKMAWVLGIERRWWRLEFFDFLFRRRMIREMKKR